MAASRSPSPAIAPPIAATPGPRAAQLIKLYNDATSHTIKACNYDNFAACFPTSAANVPEALEELHKDFVKRLDDRCKEEFEVILQERNAVSSLNDLDRLVDEARKRKQKAESESNGGPVQAPTPPHTLPASSLYLSHLGPSIQDQHVHLNAKLQAMQNTNNELLAQILQQRKEIEGHVRGLEAVIQDVDDSLSSVPHDDMLALTSETVSMDEGVRTNG